MDIQKVGNIIKRRREFIGLSKSEFARRLGCTPQNIDYLEDRSSISFEKAVRINAILEFDIFTYYQVGSPGLMAELAECQKKVIKLQDDNARLHQQLQKKKQTKTDI